MSSSGAPRDAATATVDRDPALDGYDRLRAPGVLHQLTLTFMHAHCALVFSEGSKPLWGGGVDRAA